MFKHKTKVLTIALLAVSLLVVGSVSILAEEDPRYGGTFVTANPYGEAVSLDPLKLPISNAGGIGVALQVHEGLVKFDTTELEVEPAIAKSWTVGEDNKTYTFNLREGVKFHNGTEVTAEDFKYSFERVMDPEKGSVHLGLFDNVVGAKEFKEGEAEGISGIKVLDEYTLQIKLEKVDVAFLSNLTEIGAVVVPKGAIEEMGQQKFARNPVGAGPFKFKSWKGNTITLSAFEDYWDGRPYLDTVKVKWMPEVGSRGAAFDSKDLDAVVAMPTQYARWKKQDVPMVETAELWTRHIGFNTDWGPFKKEKVRKAFNYAINVQPVVDVYLHGKAIPATGVFPPSMPAYNEDLEGYPYNPEKAKELLEEAGYPDGFKCKVIGDAHSPAWGAPAVGAVMPQLARVGIKVEPVPMEYGTMVKRVMNNDYQAYIDAFGGIGPRPLGYLMRFHSDNIGSTNWWNYENEEVDSLLDEAKTTVDFDERKALLQQAEEIIVEDAPIWFNNYNLAVMAHHPWVHGIQPYATDMYYQDLEEVWVEESSPRAGK